MENLTLLTTLLPIAIIALVAVIVVPIVLRLARSSAQRQQLLQHGESAPATILQIAETGMRVNDQPQVRLLLDVRPTTRPAFQAQTTMLISYLQASMFQPGMMVEVKYDPNDTSKVTVSGVTGTMGGMGGMGGMAQAGMLAGGAQPQQLQAMMIQIDAANRALLASGEAAQAAVLKLDPMGFTVNGNNPAVNVLLEVRPSNRAAFQATAQGVIAETSLTKYQPGAVIWVKFDPDDTSKVAIDHA
jgi:hypothetical protein